VLDVWAVGEAYESYIGRWSRLVAAQHLDWLAVPPGLRWLDLGCGTGALSESILARCSPGQLTALDRSAGFLQTAARRITDPRVHFACADGRARSC
jgi:ubiquinone/menaquinone biosynthesis C-methylase UbiE